jgi:PAS domain S-box-containing protein
MQPDRERLLRELRAQKAELEAQNRALLDSQRQLQESRGRYADLYDFAPVPFCTLDRGGIVLEINLTGAALLGAERSEIVGRPLASLAKLDEPEALLRHLRRCLRSASPVTGELGLATSQGPMEFQLVSVAVRGPSAPPAACRTVLVDVTRWRVAEREAHRAHESETALRAQLEGLDRAFSAVTAAVAAIAGPDIRPVLQIIADGARQLVGAQVAALGLGGEGTRRLDPWVTSGMTPAQETALRTCPGALDLLAGVVQAGRAVRLRDLREQAKAAGLPPLDPPLTSFLAVPIVYRGELRGNLHLANKRRGGASVEFTADDQRLVEMLAGRAAFALEIARLRQFEARERARLEILAKVAPLLSESIDYGETLQAIARLVVPAAADLAAIDLVDETGTVQRVATYHPDRRKQQLFERLVDASLRERAESVRSAIRTKRPQRRDFLEQPVAEFADAESRGLLDELGATCSIAAPLVLRDRVIGVLGLVMADSGRRYGDEDLELAQEIARHAALAIEHARLYRAAEGAVRARDDLLAIVSHDLRNFLSTVRLSAEMLIDRSPPQERRRGRRLVDAILGAATRMDRLIGALRDATIIETGRLTVEPKAEDAAALIDEAFKTLAPQVEAAALRLRVGLDDRRCTVRCDRERVLQVLANLVGNAVKFSEPGGEIRIDLRPGGGSVEVTVSDTGCGIPERQLPHLFERGQKLRPRGRKGTGLGLFIAKGIVEAHGGRIWATSAPGVGSAFHFTLPVDSGAHPGEPAGSSREAP